MAPSESVLIQTLRPENHQLAYALHCQNHNNPWSQNSFLNGNPKHYTLLEALSPTGEFTGYCVIHHLLDEATLMDIAVDGSFRRQGIASKLIKVMIESVSNAEAETLWLEVMASNTQAIRLYHQLGFCQVDVRKDYYVTASGKEDGIVMCLAVL